MVEEGVSKQVRTQQEWDCSSLSHSQTLWVSVKKKTNDHAHWLIHVHSFLDKIASLSTVIIIVCTFHTQCFAWNNKAFHWFWNWSFGPEKLHKVWFFTHASKRRLIAFLCKQAKIKWTWIGLDYIGSKRKDESKLKITIKFIVKLVVYWMFLFEWSKIRAANTIIL